MCKMKESGVAWIGNIPSNWTLYKMKHIGRYINGYAFKPEDWSATGLPIIRIQDLTGSNDNPNFYNGQLPEKYHIYNGDILVSWAATLSAFVWDKGEGWLNQHIFKAIPDEKITDFNYYFWLLKTAMTYMNDDNKHGIMMQHVTLPVFNNFIVPVPPKAQQTALTVVLDKKASQIDALIANVQTQIEKLKAYKQSLITEVVTRGLDPSVPMKDSGVEWIGKIPAHWEITRIKNLFVLRNERNFKPLDEVNLISLYTDLGVVQHSELTETTGNRAVNADGYKLVYERDIVVNIILCWMGAIGMSKYNGVTSPAYDVYKPKENVFSEYYHYLFRTKAFNGECYRYGRGIMMMRWRTYSTEFSAISVPLPPKDEQRTIVAYLDDRCRRVDQLIAIKQAKIDKLNEYKKSLIYEYVTGKKEA